MARRRGSYAKLNRLLHETHREVMKLLKIHKRSKELKMLRGAILAAIEWLENQLTEAD